MKKIYCKIINGQIIARENKENPGSALDGDGNPFWRPLVIDPEPPFDPATQVRTRNEVIEALRVHLFWTVTDKTQQELDDEETARKADLLDEVLASGPGFKLTHSVILYLLNKVLALEGKAPLTAKQYKTQVIKPRL